MKIILVLAALVFSTSAFSMTCEIYESNKGVEKVQTVTVEGSDNPHGSMVMLNLQLLSETVGGFVAVVKETIVISLNHIPSGVATASHTPVNAKTAYHQIVLPGGHITEMQVVMVSCKTQLAIEEALGK